MRLQSLNAFSLTDEALQLAKQEEDNDKKPNQEKENEKEKEKEKEKKDEDKPSKKESQEQSSEEDKQEGKKGEKEPTKTKVKKEKEEDSESEEETKKPSKKKDSEDLVAYLQAVIKTIPISDNPKELSDFNYHYVNGKLVNMDTNTPFHWVNQAHYDALGDVIVT